MRPIFTLHAGEFLVGQHLENTFRDKRLWVPTKDTGVDLLVTNIKNTKAVSFQVKFSRDFLPIMKIASTMRRGLRSCTWFSLDENKIIKSTADYWVFVLMGFDNHSIDYAIIKPAELLRRLKRTGSGARKLQTYFWVTTNNRCWLTRDLTRLQQEQIAQGNFEDKDRDLTRHLNNWGMISSL